jgi:hypothetical protein
MPTLGNDERRRSEKTKGSSLIRRFVERRRSSTTLIAADSEAPKPTVDLGQEQTSSEQTRCPLWVIHDISLLQRCPLRPQ